MGCTGTGVGFLAEKWQQWMPLDVNDWRGSPSVRAMHPAARSGYLDLILAQWDSDDCSLPGDAIELAELSFLGDELWGVHGARILRKFDVLENGRLRNPVCFDKWNKAKEVFDNNREKRSEAGKAGNAKRWAGHAKKSQVRQKTSQTRGETVANGSQNIATGTGTGTGTKTKEQEQKPSPARKREREPDVRHTACKEQIFAYYRHFNGGEDPDWEGREGKALGMLLSRNPAMTAESMRQLLGHRARSEVNHAERPALWLGVLTSYRNGPLNQYGKPLNAGAPNVRTNPNIEALRLALADESDQGTTHSGGDDARSEVGRRNDQALFRSLSAGAV